MKEGLTDLERHEGELLMTEFSLLGELSLYGMICKIVPQLNFCHVKYDIRVCAVLDVAIFDIYLSHCCYGNR